MEHEYKISQGTWLYEAWVQLVHRTTLVAPNHNPPLQNSKGASYEFLGGLPGLTTMVGGFMALI